MRVFGRQQRTVPVLPDAAPSSHSGQGPGGISGLQRAAGNQAVTRLLRAPVQRAPFAAPPVPAARAATADGDDLAKRIEEARKVAGSSGWFGKAVTELYAARPRLVDDLVTALLSEHLKVPELAGSTASLDPKVKPSGDRLRGTVKAGAAGGLNTAMAAIAAALPARTAEFEPFVTPRLKGSMWTFDALVLEAWSSLLQCTPFPDTSAVAYGARKVKEELGKQVATAVKEYSAKHFTGAALAALSGPPREAARAWVSGRPEWVVKPAELDALTDHILTTTKVAHKDRSDPVWVDMRSRSSDFVVAAETDIIKAEIDKHWTAATTEDVWFRARGLYVGTMDKPVWRFYKDDIVAFSIFSHSIDKAYGVHRNVAPELARVGASAQRLAGAAWSSTKLPKGYGFRFQPQDGKFESAHVSLHATGRAVDFDEVHNPFASGAAKGLVGVLTGVDFDAPGGMPGGGELAKLGSEIAAKHARKAEIEAQLSAATEEEERGALAQQLKDLEAEIAALPNRADVVSIRDRAGRAHDDLIKAQTAFLTLWQELTAGSGKASGIEAGKVLGRITQARLKLTGELAPVEQQIKDAVERIETLKNQAGELKKEGKAADPVKVAEVKERLAKAQTDLDPLRAAKKGLDEKLKQVSDLEKRFGPKGDGKQLLVELEKSVVAGGGMTNMPKWMVQAFAENGFTWGGGWHDPLDAMHYSSMTPVPGLSQPGM